jgi:16S rRNA processing protein RimM
VRVQVGRVGKPHGLDGAFVVEGASDDDRRWEIGAALLADGLPARIEVSRRVGGRRRAIRLDRAVERGAELAVDRSALPSPAPDRYYVFQLVGLLVVDERGDALGRVADVRPGAANDNLQLDDGSLVPLIEDAVRSIDAEDGRIVVDRGFLA